MSFFVPVKTLPFPLLNSRLLTYQNIQHIQLQFHSENVKMFQLNIYLSFPIAHTKLDIPFQLLKRKKSKQLLQSYPVYRLSYFTKQKGRSMLQNNRQTNQCK